MRGRYTRPPVFTVLRYGSTLGGRVLGDGYGDYGATPDPGGSIYYLRLRFGIRPSPTPSEAQLQSCGSSWPPSPISSQNAKNPVIFPVPGFSVRRVRSLRFRAAPENSVGVGTVLRDSVSLRTGLVQLRRPRGCSSRSPGQPAYSRPHSCAGQCGSGCNCLDSSSSPTRSRSRHLGRIKPSMYWPFSRLHNVRCGD